MVAALAAAGQLALAPVRAQVQPAPPPPPTPAAATPATPAVVPRASELAPQPPPAAAEAELPPSPLPRELGKPEDDVRITIRRYEVDAQAPAALREALPALTQDLLGPDRGFDDLLAARARITRFLQSDLGYYLGYAYIPEQAFADGVVRIGVLEGRLDRVLLRWPVEGLPVRRELVQAHLDLLQPGSILRVRDVERVVFLVNDLRGIRARFEVQPGSLPGTASLVVVPEAEPRWSARADVDGNGSRFLGAIRFAGMGQWNSPFGRGDSLSANAMVSHTGGLRFALLGYTTPLGGNGWKLGGSVSAVQYQLDTRVFTLDLNGSAFTANAYVLYPHVRGRNLNLFSVATLEHKTYEDRSGKGGGTTRKTVDTLALGITGDLRDAVLGGGVNTYDATLVAGRLDRQPVNREDPASFAKLNFSATRLQDLLVLAPTLADRSSGKLLGYVALRGQLGLHNLDTTEQFRVAGPDGVRAFAPGEGTGDSGLLLTLEARLLPPESWFGRLSGDLVLSAFVDMGHVRYRTKPPQTGLDSDPNTDTFAGVGLAAAWVKPGSYALRMSVAAPLAGKPRSDTREPAARVYLSASKFFQ